jgi:colanic acid biosynthesis protein WcaH
MRLSDEEFGRVIAAAPLVSIDLIVMNEAGQVLLGRRRNRPAQGYWFVPGGRIRKEERLREALLRIAQTELGCVTTPGRLLGAFDHIYPDNFLGQPDISTHYVVLGYRCGLPAGSRPVADRQHAQLQWWDVPALLASAEVHANTKLYFQAESESGIRCHGD